MRDNSTLLTIYDQYKDVGISINIHEIVNYQNKIIKLNNLK